MKHFSTSTMHMCNLLNFTLILHIFYHHVEFSCLYFFFPSFSVGWQWGRRDAIRDASLQRLSLERHIFLRLLFRVTARSRSMQITNCGFVLARTVFTWRLKNFQHNLQINLTKQSDSFFNLNIRNYLYNLRNELFAQQIKLIEIL